MTQEPPNSGIHPDGRDPALPGLEVSVLVAARNEEKNIPRVAEKIARAFSAHRISGEALFVDDGSTDQTQRAIEEACGRFDFLRAVRHSRSRGLSEVLQTGLRHLKGKIVILLPADLESDPEEDIPKLLEEMKRGYDAVAAWRQGRADGKLFASNIYNFVCRKLFRLRIHDMNWIKAVRRDILTDVPLRTGWYRFLLPLLAAKGCRIGEVRTDWYPRKAGRSKFGLSRILVSFFDVLAVWLLLTFARHEALRGAADRGRPPAR